MKIYYLNISFTNVKEQLHMSDRILDPDNAQGIVYVLWNPVFSFYGECYKIGSTNDEKNRLAAYSTSYPEVSEMKYITNTRKDYRVFEKVLHYRLKSYRMKHNREFFKCSLQLIIDTILSMINNGYSDVEHKRSVIPRKVKEVIVKQKKIKPFRMTPDFLRQCKTNIQAFLNTQEDKTFEHQLSLLDSEEHPLSEIEKALLYYCLMFLNIVGFVSLDDNRKIRPDWTALHEFVKIEFETIQSIYNCKKLAWRDELEGYEKHLLSMFVRDKLSKTLGSQFEATSTKYVLYRIVDADQTI